MWALSRSSLCGSVTATRAMLAWPGLPVRVGVQRRVAVVFGAAGYSVVSFGANGSAPQLATWKRFARAAVAPSVAADRGVDREADRSWSG